MIKKENRIFEYKISKSQYIPLLDQCKNVRKFEQSLVINNNIIYNIIKYKLPKWEQLSIHQKLGLIFEFLIDDNWQTLTLLFSLEYIEKNKNKIKITDAIRRNINQNLKNNLGFIPDYLFTIEFDNDNFHIHGIINPCDNITEIKRVFKTSAFGRYYKRNSIPRNKKIICDSLHSKEGWINYIMKTHNSPQFDIYICNGIRRKTKSIYSDIENQLRYLKKQANLTDNKYS